MVRYVVFVVCGLLTGVGSMYFAPQDAVRENYITLAAHITADHLHKALRTQLNELLGVPAMQSIIDGLCFKQTSLNTSVVREVASRLDASFGRYTSMLLATRQYAIPKHPLHEIANAQFYRSVTECSRISPSSLAFEEQFGTRVNLSTGCTVVTRNGPTEEYFPDRNITSVFQANSRESGLRWQYVIGVHGTHIEYPAHMFPVHRHRHWNPFLSVALPHRRRLLILLDIGTIQTEAQLSKMKSVAKVLLESTTPGDMYMLMVASGSEVVQACARQGFVAFTSDRIAEVSAFIDELRLSSDGSYSHANALQAAYMQIAEETNSWRERSPSISMRNVLLYVSRGVMSELSEAATVLSTLAVNALQTNVLVKINTLALVDGEKAPMLWSAEFLKNIADQNFSKYKLSFNEKLQLALDATQLIAPKGKMIVLNESEHSSLTLRRMLEIFADDDDDAYADDRAKDTIRWSFPFTEYQSTSVSMSTGVYQEQRLISVVGMDVNMDVIADVIKHMDAIVMAPRNARPRIFICDLQGRVVMDSRMRSSQPWPLHIGELEAWPSKDRWVSDHFASEDVSEGSFDLERSTAHNETVKLKYTWIRLKNAPFVVVLALKASDLEKKLVLLAKNSRQEYALDNLIYHRLDIQRDVSLPYCTHFGALSSLKLGAVYLSPSCFTASSMQRSPSPQWISNYWVYLGDSFGLIRNTGIRSGVRDHVGALSGIVPYWRDKAAPISRDSVIRRYVATSRGVMITYPATVVRDTYDPDMQTWYTRALKFPGRIVITGPILDEEVGQVVTLSTAVFEGQPGSMHNSKDDQIFAVIAMDVTVGFVAKLLRSTIPACRESRRCVLFDDLGYVLTRGSETGTSTVGGSRSSQTSSSSPSSSSRGAGAVMDAVERFHMSHLEPQLATHLISQELFVEKRQCAQWQTRTVERFFQFNVTFSDALTVYCDDGGSNGKQKSLRAEVIPVPQTNVFLALINESCLTMHPVQAFCPCSVSDRRCLLCTRFDDAECECPCQCPIAFDRQCAAENSTLANTVRHSWMVGMSAQRALPPLEQCPDSIKIMPFTMHSTQKAALPKCIEVRCGEHGNADDCLGVIGCQWCAFAEDAQTPLESAFCSPIDSCYSGVKGRRIRGFADGSSQVSGQWPMATPVGPVAAGIMSVFLIMVMAVYCYRSQVNRLVEARSLTDSFGAPLCGRPGDDDDIQFDHDGLTDNPGKVMSVIQLASFERTSIPPATVRPQYRTSPRTESSDHGYSTMTDRMAGEESECATSSVNISRQTGRTQLTTIYANGDECCASLITTEADVHHIPTAHLLVS